MRYALAATAVAVAALAPSAAHATCLTTFDRLGVTITSCAAPGGPVSTQVCVRETICHPL